MKLEHYLTSISGAIERHQAHTDALWEAYAGKLRALETLSPEAIAEADAEFTAGVAKSYLDMQDTFSNLRKWPRT